MDKKAKSGVLMAAFSTRDVQTSGRISGYLSPLADDATVLPAMSWTTLFGLDAGGDGRRTTWQGSSAS